MNLIAICIFGVEAVLSRELKNLGIKIINISSGRIEFEGDYKTIAKANLWLRTAERVYISAGKFKSYTFDDLYDGTARISWEDYISKNGRINVRSSSINSKLFSQRDCQRIVKKSIVDRMTDKFGLVRLPEDGPEYKIEVFIHNDNTEINIDTTGIGLHKRGYRTLNVEAPLKETTAAALINISYWRPGRVFLDPFCGSGTFPIEVAMMEADIAPGLNRDFLFQLWNEQNKKILQHEKQKAIERINISKDIKIYGSDISKGNIEICRRHAKAAGVSAMIEFKTEDARKIKPSKEYGVLICNPPYGRRISEKDDVRQLYSGIGRMFDDFESWSKYVLTDSTEFEKISGYKADKRRKIYNGTISCTFYQFFGPKPL